MSEAPYLLERRRAARLHRFGLGLGIVLAALFHAALFWGPEVEYSPLLEEAKVRRVLIAQPYRPMAAPAPVPPPAPGRQQAAPQPPAVAPAPQPTREPAPQPKVQPAPAPTPERGSSQAESTQAARTVTSREGAAGSRREAQTSQSASQPEPGSEVWAQLMANLEARKEGIEQKRSALEAELAAAPRSDRRGGAAGANGDGDGWLDPRIRVNVVSYPESSIERVHPPIPYPDLRFRQRELEKGICRVYYRVWTDTMGRIVRRQVKTPETRELQERYKAFVDVVAESVDEWPLDRMQAEIHIDVLFEIE